VDDDAALLGRDVGFPCVLKPVILSGSRGVIRSDNKAEFVGAFARLAAILDSPEIKSRGAASRQILVEEFIPGKEVAVEGILGGGVFRLLAIFDKPDSLDGPFFEETIYVTPSRLPVAIQQEIADCAAGACGALGLTEGPVHAELRINDAGPWVIEVAARSIGGHCSRVLRFREDRSLEELILQQALGLEIGLLQPEQEAAGVMMIPIPRAGILEKVRGLAEASATRGIDEVLVTAHPGQRLVPLPEGSRYLGFIFASGAAPRTVEAALREAHDCLEFVMVDGAEAAGLCC
ncbi:MAG: ATP-grasp domain-containing protein, partial [Acidobacteria bacterium]|nr:ATP-grasp domain-containing protein [Acidobacteriota bacterium]